MRLTFGLMCVCHVSLAAPDQQDHSVSAAFSHVSSFPRNKVDHEMFCSR